MNAYILWFNENREKIKNQYFNDTSLSSNEINKQIVKKAGELWRKMTDIEKQPYLKKQHLAKKSKTKKEKSQNPNTNKISKNKKMKKVKTKNKNKK